MDEFPNVQTSNYNTIRSSIKSGDLLLCSGSSLISIMIQGATNSVWSHVALIIRLDIIDRIMVLESVESIGVRTVPLSNYVRNYNASGKGYPGRMMLARHQQFDQNKIANLSKKTVDLLGYPYGTEDIMRIAARIGRSAFGFDNDSQAIKPQRDYICSEYVDVCLQSVGITIDYNSAGFIAPADIALCPQVKPIGYIQSENDAIDKIKFPVTEFA